MYVKFGSPTTDNSHMDRQSKVEGKEEEIQLICMQPRCDDEVGEPVMFKPVRNDDITTFDRDVKTNVMRKQQQARGE